MSYYLYHAWLWCVNRPDFVVFIAAVIATVVIVLVPGILQ